MQAKGLSILRILLLFCAFCACISTSILWADIPGSAFAAPKRALDSYATWEDVQKAQRDVQKQQALIAKITLQLKQMDEQVQEAQKKQMKPEKNTQQQRKLSRVNKNYTIAISSKHKPHRKRQIKPKRA